MTQSKHTPAPWRISDNPRTPYLVYGSNDYAVADCKVYHNKTDINADMNLIAAAPELLEALELIANCVTKPNEPTELGEYEMDKVKAAIAKAKGQ